MAHCCDNFATNWHDCPQKKWAEERAKKEKMRKQTYIKVPIEWLERLGEIVDKYHQVENEIQEEGKEHKFNAWVAVMAGYASSAKTIIKYNERIEE